MTAPARAYWDAAPAAVDLFGRDEDIDRLRASLEDRGERIVVLTGVGGVGKSTLARVYAGDAGESFSIVIWIGLINGPSAQQIFENIRRGVDPNAILQDQADPRILVQDVSNLLASNPALVVFDNFESIMQIGSNVGVLREGYQPLADLFNRVAETEGEGSLLITSREVPRLTSELAANRASASIIHLEGLSSDAAESYVAAIGLKGSKAQVKLFVAHHGGNPYALRLAASHVGVTYPGRDLGAYVAAGLPLPGGVFDILTEQYSRLSLPERMCLLRLVAEREPMVVEELVDALRFCLPAGDLQRAVEGMHTRNLLEAAGTRFDVQNLLREFASERLISEVVDQLALGTFRAEADTVVMVPLIRPQADDHIREAQLATIVDPILQRLRDRLGAENHLRAELLTRLSYLQGLPAKSVGFAAGTLVNLLVRMQVDLTGIDLSDLVLWNAYLEEAQLRDVTLRDSDVSGCSFSETIGVVTASCFVDSGNALVIGTAEGTIQLWSLIDWNQKIVQAHSGYVRALARHPHRPHLFSVGDDGYIRVWDISSLELIHERSPEHQVFTPLKIVAVSQDGQYVAWGGERGVIQVGDTENYHVAATLSAHQATVRALAFSNDTELVSACEGGRVAAWNILDHNTPRMIRELTSPQWWISRTKNEQKIALGGQDGRIRVLSTETLAESLAVIVGSGVPLWAATQSGSYLAVATSTGTVVLVDPESGDVTRAIVAHSNWTRTVASHPSRPLVASGGDDQTVRVFDTTDGRTLRVLRGGARSFWAVEYSTDGEWLAAAGNDHIVYLREEKTQTVFRLRGHSTRLRALAFNPSADILASAGDDGVIVLWNVEEKRSFRRLVGHVGPVWALDFHPSGSTIASAGEDGFVRTWSIGAETSRRRIMHTHRVWAISVSYSPDGQYLASGADNGVVALSRSDGSQQRLLRDPGAEQVWALSWSTATLPVLFSAGRDSVVRAWTIDEDVPQSRWPHFQRVWSSICTLDGAGLLLAGDEGTVVEISTADGSIVRSFSPGPGRVRCIALNPDGDRFATAGDDGVIRLYRRSGDLDGEFNPDRQYERLNIVRTRGLSDGQRTSLTALGARDDIRDDAAVPESDFEQEPRRAEGSLDSTVLPPSERDHVAAVSTTLARPRLRWWRGEGLLGQVLASLIAALLIAAATVLIVLLTRQASPPGGGEGTNPSQSPIRRDNARDLSTAPPNPPTGVNDRSSPAATFP